MKNIKLFSLLLFITSLFISCSNPNSNNKKTVETEAVEASSERTADHLDTIVGRGCLEVVTEIPYDIPAQRFDETAQILAHAIGCFIESDLSKTGSIQVNAIKGRMSIRDAILTAIDGSNLKITEQTDKKIKVELIQ